MFVYANLSLLSGGVIYSCLDGRAWIEKCLEVWSSIPNCHFWNSQWVAILARVIKNYDTITWEPLLPILFAKYLNMFEVRLLYF